MNIMKSPITVTTIETTEQTFAAVMGITPERENAIDSLMDKCHGETDTYPDAIAYASGELLNVNELAYVCFHLGAFAESQRSKQELLSKLLE